MLHGFGLEASQLGLKDISPFALKLASRLVLVNNVSGLCPTPGVRYYVIRAMCSSVGHNQSENKVIPLLDLGLRVCICDGIK